MPDLARLSPPAIVHNPGWYPDPSRETDLRWWDGKQWTDRTRLHDPGGLSTLAGIGIALGLVFPLGGLICGVILLARSEIGPGFAALAASCMGMVIWLAVAS
jgi:Protein of unknown function (DUF2510)